jgi:hypothetical protein
MFRFLHNLFSGAPAPKKNQAFMRSVHYHVVDRRQYQRIVYPAVGAVGCVPAVQCDGLFLEPINISLGGILLQNPTLKTSKIGTQFIFKFSWNNKKYPDIHQTAQLVRIYKSSWHFRFVQTERKYFAEFPRIFKSGSRGAMIIEFRQDQIPAGEHIVELWMSEQGDYVIFQKPPTENLEITTIQFDGTKYRFMVGKGIYAGAKNAAGVVVYDTPVSYDLVDELLVFLVNFKLPSHRIRRTISDLVDKYYRTKSKNDRRSA